MNKTKRFCAIALAAMMAATAFVGCGPAAPTDTGTTTASGGEATTTTTENTDPLNGEAASGPIKLKVWGPDAVQETLKEQCAAFSESMKAYGTVEIEVVNQGEDQAATNVLTDSAAAADVFGFACDQLDKLVTAGALFEVAGPNAEFVKENNSEASVSAATKNDKIWAFPETGDNSYILVYDKRVVSDEQAKTLEGVFEACKAANKNFVMDGGNGFYSCIFMFTGGLVIDGLEEIDGEEVQKFADYDEDKVVKTMLAFRELFVGNKDNFLSGDCTKVSDGFKAGTCGAGIDGSWDFSIDKEALGENAGFAVLPTINVDGEDLPIVNMFGYKLLGVNSATKYPATSIQLAKYLSGEECQKQRAEKLNWGPSNKAVAESDIVKNDAALSAILAQQANSVPQVAISPTFWSPVGTFGSKILDADTPMDEAAARSLIKQTISNVRDE
jgi:arabinogalactan oligomer/maltooligosaccharide transport system substrate-binding protein